MFVHEALLEYLKVRGHVIPVKGLKKKYEQLKEENPQSGLSGITEEYAVSGVNSWWVGGDTSWWGRWGHLVGG